MAALMSQVMRLDHGLELRELDDEYLPALCGIWCDPLIMRYTTHGALTQQQARERMTELQEASRTTPRTQYGMAVTRAADHQLVGTVVLDVERHRSGYLHSMAVRPRSGALLARDVMVLTAGFAFEHLGLHRLWGGCDPDNGAANHFFPSVGCTRQGIIRDFHHTAGGWRDVVVWDMLDHEFQRLRRTYTYYCNGT